MIKYNIFNFLIYLSIYFFSFFIIKKKIKVLDIRDNQIPLIGGLYIILCICSFIIFFDIPDFLYKSFTAIFIVALLGFIDDKFILNRRIRLISQFAISIFLIYLGFEISYINLSQNYILELGTFSSIITILFFISLMNAYNFYDGFDGQLSINMFLVLFFLYYYEILNYEYNFLIINLAVIYSIFFTFNLFSKKFKSFLGDSGSLTSGLILSIIIIDANVDSRSSLIFFLWLSLPFLDFLRVVLSRLLKSKNPTKSYQDHIHSILSHYFNNKLLVTFTTILLQIFMFIFFLILYNKNLILFSFISYLIFFIFYFVIFEHLIKKSSLSNS